MAGIVPFSKGSPGRKQWNIKDRKSLRRLRSQLAEDGCPESQVVLAKQLLQEKNVMSMNDNEENARLGVFWLIKASEQGNVEATNILRNCLETGEGITEHNYMDVKVCLTTSQNEKLAKRAAREMFMSLSAGQDFITLEQLKKRISKICDSPSTSISKEGNENLENDFLETENSSESNLLSNRKAGSVDEEEGDTKEGDLGCGAKNENFGEKLTENHLESAASHYSKGELPLVQGVFALASSGENVRQVNFLQQALFHPFLTVQKAHLKLLNHFSLRHRNNPFLLFSPGSAYIQFFAILLLYPLINVENLLLFIPMCVYHVSFFFMTISTLQMLQSQKEYTDFRVWSRLFLSYDRDGNLNTEDAEFEFCKKNLRPYGVYFLSLLLNLMVYPFISELWIPHSEFAIISFAFTFLTLYSFHERTSKKLDFLLLFSFAINVLAKYPYETDGVVRQTWRFLDVELPSLQSYGLPCFATQIVGTGVEFCLNFHGFFYLLIPGIFFRMASRNNWRGIYKILMPHCVTLSWWQVAVFCCRSATLYGLLRSALALVGLVFFLPFLGIATMILPVVAVFKHFGDFALTSKSGIFIALISILIVIAYCKSKFNLGSNVIKIQILLAVVSAAFLASTPLNDFFSDGTKTSEIQAEPAFTWDQYSSICQKSSWDKRSQAEMQFGCVHLNGVEINWKGVVDNVRIIKVQNNLLKLLNNVPQALRRKLLCHYGESYNPDCTDEEDATKMNLCKVLSQINSKNKCHINSWNKYEFEVLIKMNSGKWNSMESTIRLIADDSMKNLTLNLQPRDRIWFSGVMNYPETIGSENLMISASEIGCINCSNKSLTSMKRQLSKFTGHYFAIEIYNGFKRILNFVFNPVINFR